MTMQYDFSLIHCVRNKSNYSIYLYDQNYKVFYFIDRKRYSFLYLHISCLYFGTTNTGTIIYDCTLTNSLTEKKFMITGSNSVVFLDNSNLTLNHKSCAKPFIVLDHNY